MNFSEIAESLGDIVGKHVKYVQVPYETAKAGMIKAGMPAWFADDIVMLMQSWGNGKGSIVSTYVEKLTGKKPIAVHEFLLRHRNRFLAAA